MASEFGILYYLWDFATDEGRLLERVVGEAAIDHVAVPVVTGALTTFHHLVQPDAPHFHTDGGWHFRTSTKVYQNVALRPKKARWFAAGDLLAQLRERVSTWNLKLHARIDLRAVQPLADDQPHVMQRNAWGQESPAAGACASNADVRELLRATLEDLARYGLAGYELCDWLPDHAIDHTNSRPYNWLPSVRRLLDMCFCASCRQIAERAGVDADAAARSVRVHVERLLNAGNAAQTSDPIRDDPVVATYVAARVSDCGAWLRRQVEGKPECRRLLLRDLGTASIGTCAPWVHMLRLPAPQQIVDQDWRARIEAELPRLAGLSLPVWRALWEDSAGLVSLVHRVVDSGVAVLDFEGLTESPTEAIDWLRQAVRFAKRG